MKKQKNIQPNNLWRLRHARGLALKQVASMLGHKSTSKVSAYENGIIDPGLKNVIKLALIYDSDFKEMFSKLVETYRNEIEGTIQQRSFVFAWPERMKVLGDLNYCTFENKIDHELSDDNKELINRHLRELSNKFHRLK